MPYLDRPETRRAIGIALLCATLVFGLAVWFVSRRAEPLTPTNKLPIRGLMAPPALVQPLPPERSVPVTQPLPPDPPKVLP